MARLDTAVNIMTQASSITPAHNGHYTLHMEGLFTHPHWVAFLFSSLAQRNISVVSGRASQNTAQVWDAGFELNFDQSAAAPDCLNYVELAHEGTLSGDKELPRLSSFNIAQHPKGLEVRLNGPDQIGFLGRMLRRIALLGLFPTEIEIDTVSGAIHDRIVFRTIGGAKVSQSVQSQLQNLLQELVTA
jgi:hypothetical protein